jgi:drug/metabolite transporter (DMT)-like permease
MAVLLFRVSGRSVHPLGLNLFKSVIATLLLVLTMLLVGDSLLPRLPLRDYGLMALSGLIGVALSDTFFFACLNLLGAGLTAVVDCLYSPFVILFAFLFLGERLSVKQIFGVVLILSALVLISRKKEEGFPPRRDLILGIGLGALAMITMAAGIVMIKPLLARSSVLWATLLRVATGAVVLAGYLFIHPRRRSILRPLASPINWKSMVPAAFLGSYIALIAWTAGMKYTLASKAAPLNQLNTIFIFILAAIFLKEKVTRGKLTAVVLAFLGAVLVGWP